MDGVVVTLLCPLVAQSKLVIVQHWRLVDGDPAVLGSPACLADTLILDAGPVPLAVTGTEVVQDSGLWFAVHMVSRVGDCLKLAGLQKSVGG